jgi:membrane associated rhomboid family serine protease
MLLPIGQEDSTVRRQPWISYALIAFNVFIFLISGGGFDGPQQREVSRLLDDASQQLSAHPYLEPPQRIVPRLAEDYAQALREERDKRLRYGPLPEPEVIAEQQAHLESTVREAFELHDRLYRFAYTPARGGGISMITALFLHSGLMHLLGNMLFFFLSGPFVEDVFGRPLFAALYLLAGIAGNVAHGLKFPNSDIPCLGASGAIAGVMGAFLVRLATSRIKFLYIPFFPLLLNVRFTFFMPAFVVLPLWFGEQLWYGSVQDEGSGVGWWAHIGGFVCGAVAAGAVRLFRIEERFINPRIENEISIVQNPGLEAALDARTRGAWDQARKEIETVLRAEPGNPDAWAEAFEIGIGSQRPGDAGRAAARLLEIYVRQGERQLAHHLIEDAQARAGGELPVRFYLSAAGFLEKDGDARMALDLYEKLTRLAPADPGCVRAHFRSGEILRKGGNLDAARKAFQQARSHPACGAEMQMAVDRALAESDARPGP